MFTARLPRSDGDPDHAGDPDADAIPDRVDKDDDSLRPSRASFRYPDGDEQYNFTYGSAASPGQRRALAAVLARYYAAARAGDTATACSMLLPSVANAVMATSPDGRGRRPGETCQRSVSTIFARMHRQLPGTIEITHVRVDGRRAEIVFGSKAMLASYIFLGRYGSGWRLEAPIASPLV